MIDLELLTLAPPESQRIYMGKRHGKHSASQEEICQTLIDLARSGKQVARLKGGDPFVFGRGGEEISALQSAGIPFELIPGMAPIEDGFLTVGAIAIVLAGAFPLVLLLTRLLKKPLGALGKLLGINEAAAAGLIASLANAIAAFKLVENMDDRGKVVNIAFAVSAAFVFGDHLGFTAGFAPQMLPAVIVAKLTGGICAVAIALLLTRKK